MSATDLPHGRELPKLELHFDKQEFHAFLKAELNSPGMKALRPKDLRRTEIARNQVGSGISKDVLSLVAPILSQAHEVKMVVDVSEQVLSDFAELEWRFANPVAEPVIDIVSRLAAELTCLLTKAQPIERYSLVVQAYLTSRIVNYLAMQISLNHDDHRVTSFRKAEGLVGAFVFNMLALTYVQSGKLEGQRGDIARRQYLDLSSAAQHAKLLQKEGRAHQSDLASMHLTTQMHSYMGHAGAILDVNMLGKILVHPESQSSTSEEWRMLGDLYLSSLTHARSLMDVTIQAKAREALDPQTTILLEPSTSDDYLAGGHILDEKHYAVIASIHGRDQLRHAALLNTQGPRSSHKFDRIDNAIRFFVLPDGSLDIYSFPTGFLRQALGDDRYEILRTQILYYLLQITSADYDVCPPEVMLAPTLRQIAPVSSDPHARVLHLPLEGRHIRPEGVLSPVNADLERHITEQTKSPHTRLLRVGMPTEERFAKATAHNVQLFAYVIDRTRGEILADQTTLLNPDGDYVAFLGRARALQALHCHSGREVRFQTYVRSEKWEQCGSRSEIETIVKG